ncbi:MAG: hypothetical protein IIX00_04000, partial [Tidjanibacter sp.]|nr:hypothetical protein [Tidjanibacter sp.]
SKQQREGETKVSPFFVMRGVETCLHTPRITKKRRGRHSLSPFLVGCFDGAPAAAEEERQAKRSQSS